MGFFKDLFSNKTVYKKEDLPNLMMAVGVDMTSKLRGFNDIDDNQTIAVNMGYFYGFLRLKFSSMTDVETAYEIVDKSIHNLGEATKGKYGDFNFIYIVQTNFNNCFENIRRAVNSEDVIEKASQLYLNDLYQKEVNDEIRLKIAKNNITQLYEMIIKLTDSMRIK